MTINELVVGEPGFYVVYRSAPCQHCPPSARRPIVAVDDEGIFRSVRTDRGLWTVTAQEFDFRDVDLHWLRRDWECLGCFAPGYVGSLAVLG